MAESITQDTAYRAVMELKTYTVTINSGKSSGESKTYTVSHGSSWSFPSCPFSPDSGKAFKDYTLNGSTYSAGSSVTVTSNLSINCNWKIAGEQWIANTIKVRVKDYINNTGYPKAMLISYDPKYEGKTLQCVFEAYRDGVTIEIALRAENINKMISASRDLECPGVTFKMSGGRDQLEWINANGTNDRTLLYKP